MQLLDMDLTKFLFEEIPKKVFETQGFKEYEHTECFLELFFAKIPKTSNWITVQNIVEWNEETKAYDIKGIRNPKDMEYLIGLFTRAKDHTLKKGITDLNSFDYFVKSCEKEIKKVWFLIKQQIFMIDKVLFINGYEYADRKLDNFGITIESANRSHLGIEWKNNQFGDKFFFIYVIDPESGLFEKDDVYSIKRSVEYFSGGLSYSKYGQYYFENLQESIWDIDGNNLLGYEISPELMKIIKFSYKMNTTFSYEEIDKIIMCLQK